jgi:predicted MFS family arabinose efflux permease
VTLTSPTPTTTAPTFRWPPVLVAALATFTVVTAEMMPVGILTPIAGALDIAPGVAGTSLSITGIVAAIVAAAAPVISGRIDKRTLLSTFLLVLAAANVMSALATSFAFFAIGRVLIGVAMGIVWANAGGLGPRLADPRNIGRAMTTIFSGVSVGMVLGLPAGTFIAALAGWRAAIWTVAGLALVAAVLVRVTFPSMPVAQRARLAGIFTPWKHRGVRSGFIITALVVIGHFAAYTFVRPVLEGGSAGGELAIVIALVVFGIAGIVGNFAIGAVSHRDPRRAIVIALVGIAAGAAALPFATGQEWLVLVVWGAAYGGIGVATQAWNRISDPTQVDASSSMLSGVFNGSIAIGSFAGGLVFDAFGGTAIMLLGAAVVLVGLVATLLSRPTA